MRERQQGGQQRHRIGLGEAIGSASAGVSPALLRANPPLKLQQALQMLDDRIQRTVLVIGRAAKLNAPHPLVPKLLFELLHQPGFANPGLAAQQHHLAFSLLGLLPALPQKLYSCSRPTSGVKPFHRHLKAALRLALPTTRYSASGVEMPLSSLGPRSWHSNKPLTSRPVGRLMTTLLGAA